MIWNLLCSTNLFLFVFFRCTKQYHNCNTNLNRTSRVRSQTHTIWRIDPLKMKWTASSHLWEDPCNTQHSILPKMHHSYHLINESPWSVPITSGSSLWKSLLDPYFKTYKYLFCIWLRLFLQLNSADITIKSIKMHQHQAIYLTVSLWLISSCLTSQPSFVQTTCPQKADGLVSGIH